MNDNFDNQKEILLSLRQEINLLRQQVDYLLRNEKTLGLLDLDVLMNRTHTVYDMLCSINLGGNDEEDDFDIDPEAISGLFGSLMQTEQPDEEQGEVSEPENEEGISDNEPVEEAFPEDSSVAEDQAEEDFVVEEKLAMISEEEPSPTVDFVFDSPIEEEKLSPETFNPMDGPIKDEPIEKEPESAEQPVGDEFGFFFRFDDVAEEQVQQPDEQPIQEEKIVHFVEEVPEEEILERDLVDGEHLVHDNPFVMPVVEDGDFAENHFDEEPVLMSKDEERVYEPTDQPTAFIEPIQESETESVEETDAENFEDAEPIQESEDVTVEEQEQEFVPESVEEFDEKPLEQEEQQETDDFEPMSFVNDFGNDDAGYELDTPETLGEHLQQNDNTLASKLQQKSISELKTAIGINDKFLFVNELFGGSMEKYNRSIENLDDMKTLNGTLIYLNELKVELQWNNSNEAYQKLLNLVHKKFE